MSGKYDDRSGHTYIPVGTLDAYTETVICDIFDNQTSIEEAEIYMEMQEAKLFRNVCIMKTLLFPVEVVLTRVLVGKQPYKERMAEQKYYWKFLRKRSNIKELKLSLARLIANGV